MLPFSEENQIEFLVKFWAQKTKDSNAAGLTDKARRLLEKFKTSLVQKQILLGVPLQLFMLADLTNAVQSTLEIDLNLYSLYEHFVKNKIGIWAKLKGDFASADDTNIHMEESNVLWIHQRIAIESVYGREVADSVRLPQIPALLDKYVICRIGFIQIGLNEEYQFNHQTYGDFFVAQMLTKSITSKISQNDFYVLLAEVLVRDKNDDNIRNFIN